MRISHTVLALACLPLAAEEAQSPPEAREIPLAYRTAAGPNAPPVQTQGLNLGGGSRLTVSKDLEGSFRYAGKAHTFSVSASDPAKPVLSVDGKALPDGAYTIRSAGYVYAFFQLEDGQQLQVVVAFVQDRAPFGSLTAMGAWSGTVEADGHKVTVIAYDRNANGDLSDDRVMLDADGDGFVTPVEDLKAGEVVQVGAAGLAVLSVDPGGHCARVRVGKPQGRNLLAELEKAPLPGRPCPDFTFTTPDGKAVSLAGLRGKVFLIDFWGHW